MLRSKLMDWELEPSAEVLRVRPLRTLLRPIRERRFLYREYEAFLDQLADADRFHVVPLREFSTTSEDRVLVGLRHDVDDRMDAALEFARLEHERGLRATYFLLHTLRTTGVRISSMRPGRSRMCTSTKSGCTTTC
jgi:hypothetical protein